MCRTRRALLAAMAVSAGGVAGCRGASNQTTTAPSSQTPAGSPPTPPVGATYAYTDSQASGNRILDGGGDVARTQPVEIATAGTPAWLLAHGRADSYWTVVTVDGTARTHRVSEGESELVTDHGAVSTPPLGYRTDEAVGVVDAPEDSADGSHPVVTDGRLLYVATDGDLVFWGPDSRTRQALAALPDAGIARVDTDRYAVYGGRTDRYEHGALGDTIEGSTLVVVDAATQQVETTVQLDAPTVFEGLAPMVADVDGDGDDELVTTVADAADGARIRVYGKDGTELATGPIYGPGWRHQLCVAPFAPDGTTELAVVRKPHVDRTVEFYRLDGDGLTITATRNGYASHRYGSRNLGGGLAVDGDDDGRTELLVPTTAQTTLEAVRRTAGGTEAAWSLPLDGPIQTNLTGVTLDGGRVAVGAGTQDTVRVWQG